MKIESSNLNLKSYLRERRQLVEEALDKVIPSEKSFPPNIHQAMRYSIFNGGKRLRSILTLASVEAVGGRIEKALGVACAIELIHTYSLVHDDLPAMDDDDYRRGKLSTHKVFGEATAILAGNALLALAFYLIASSKKFQFLNPSLRLEVMEELAYAVGSSGLMGGQLVDLESEGKEIDLPLLEYIHRHKTGALILSAIRLGGKIGGGSKEEIEALTKYGEAVGLAFQIIDDVLDIEDEQGEKKEEKRKATFPQLLGLEKSKRRARELVEKALGFLKDFDGKANPLRALAWYMVNRQS